MAAECNPSCRQVRPLTAAGYVVYSADLHMRTYRIESARNMPSYGAADGCTALMKDPLLVVAHAKPLRAPCTLHSAL